MTLYKISSCKYPTNPIHLQIFPSKSKPHQIHQGAFIFEFLSVFASKIWLYKAKGRTNQWLLLQINLFRKRERKSIIKPKEYGFDAINIDNLSVKNPQNWKRSVTQA